MVSLKDTMTSKVNQNYLFVRHSLEGNTLLDLPLDLIIDGNSKIIDYRVTISKIQVINTSLEETLIANFRRGNFRRGNTPNKHNGILMISTRETALRMRDLFEGKLFKGEIVSMAEKSGWYSVEGKAKLANLLGNISTNSTNNSISKLLASETRCQISSQEKLKIASYLNTEGLQYQGLIGLAHILPWFISRLKNKQAIKQQLSKLARWY